MMKQYIAILRGINVGGKRKILMIDLKKIFMELGFENIQTYIQSGNVIFDAPKRLDDLKTADLIKNSIALKYGFDVPVIVRTTSELNEIVQNNRYYNQKETNVNALHLTFLQKVPEIDVLKQLSSYSCTPDKFYIADNNVYLFCNGRYSESKLTNTFFEKKLNIAATTRNWKTVLKLATLSNKIREDK